VEIDGKVYGAKADERGPIGGGAGYVDVLKDGDFVVKDLESLTKALKEVKTGQVIFVPGETEIDLTTFVYLNGLVLDVPKGATLGGERGRKGSKGALLTSDALNTPVMLNVVGPDVRITGIRLRGPNPKVYKDHHNRSFGKGGRGHDYYYKFPISDGIKTEHDRLEVDNCEISGFSRAGVRLLRGDGHQIHHNYIHHCQYAGLGYGVCVDDTFPLIEYNILEQARHSIADTGVPGSGYTARHNVVGRGNFDMHGGRDRHDGTNIAGKSLVIQNNTFFSRAHAVNIRGVPEKETKISRNWIPHRFDPVFLGARKGEPLIEVRDNLYGWSGFGFTEATKNNWNVK